MEYLSDNPNVDKIIILDRDDKKKFGKTIRLGMGNCNFKKLFKVLKKNNYNGNLILQTARAKNNSHIYELNRNLNFLKSFL